MPLHRWEQEPASSTRTRAFAVAAGAHDDNLMPGAQPWMRRAPLGRREGVHHSLIEGAVVHELGVGSLRHSLASSHDDDVVGVEDGGQSVCDREYCAARGVVADRVVNCYFR